ncbi:MAG: hypothetical protein PHR79_01750 [Bacteroidales bacterium]|nr:hypothetical protein [Bacteroidales bacterium]
MKRAILNVKTYTQSNLLGLVFENSKDNSYLSSEKTYDKNGNLLCEKDFSADGSMDLFNIYEYDDQNNISKAVYMGDFDEVFETHFYEYNEENLLIKEILCYGDETPEDDGALYDIIEFQYDENNNRIKKTSIDSEGTFNNEKNYEYRNGKLIREYNFGEDKKMEVEILYKYDNHGNLIEESRIDHIENVKNTLKYEFDERNFKTKSLIYNNFDQLIKITRMEYDDAQNLLQMTEESSGSHVVKSYEYNESKTKIIAEKLHNIEGELKEFRNYEYDEDLPLKIENFVHSPESTDADEDGFLLNGTVQFEYTFFE